MSGEENTMIDELAKVICDVWGYNWDGPKGDEQTAPEHNEAYDERPSKQLYREAARAVLTRLMEKADDLSVVGGIAFEDSAFGEQDTVCDAAVKAFRAMLAAANT